MTENSSQFLLKCSMENFLWVFPNRYVTEWIMTQSLFSLTVRKALFYNATKCQIIFLLLLLVAPCWKSGYFDSITRIWYHPDSLIVYKILFTYSYWQIWDKFETWMLALWTNKTCPFHFMATEYKTSQLYVRTLCYTRYTIMNFSCWILTPITVGIFFGIRMCLLDFKGQ